MTKNKKIRIELRFDEVEDKDMIDFIDKYGSTRAGFIKQVLKMYKNQIGTMTPTPLKVEVPEKPETENTKKKKRPKDISISSKDMD